MKFYASGKLLLFGEYLVLRGAECLAIPLGYGQCMEVENRQDQLINWTSSTKKETWFTARFSNELEIIESTDNKKASVIRELLLQLKSEDKSLFHLGLDFKTYTDFPTQWGFGTSSTLVALLAQWSSLDPFALLEISFGGSGYDVACASAKSPILYKKKNNVVVPVNLSSAVTSKILFIYSGQKQETKTEVKRFKMLDLPAAAIENMNKIVERAANSSDIETFEDCMNESENQLSDILKLPTIKSKKFGDYPFAIKSLGAWGGDFFMATYRNETEARRYFAERGYPVQFQFNELIKE